jgi:type I restriction enzyme, S subunit
VSQWREMTLVEAVEINPPRHLPRGGESVYVAMDDLGIWQRQISHWARREFSGSGSRFQNGDTLLARITPCLENGKTAFVKFLAKDETSHGSTEFIVLSGKQGTTDNLFVYYLARSEPFRDFAIQRMEGSSGRQRVPSPAIANFRFSVPPLPEQRAIAAVLGSLDDKIELNRRMNETLEALAQSLFKSWFVDATQSALPKGWTERALYDCADYINGAAFCNEHFSADRQGLPVIKIGELKDGITAQTKFCGIEREPKYRINSGDILFSWSGSPDTSIDTFIWTEGEGWLNQHIFKIQFKRPVEKFFVYYLLRHLKPVFIEIARDKQTTGLGHVTGQDLKRLKTFFPTDDVLEKFNRVVEPLFQKVYSNLHESRTLAALRDALLPKLLSGELRVPAASGSMKASA